MPKKEILLLLTIILVGLIDWLTTISGILFFGATEVNPLLSALTRSSLILFSVVKLGAVVLVGFVFYTAVAISKSLTDWHFTKNFLLGGYSIAFLVLTFVSISNFMAIFRI